MSACCFVDVGSTVIKGLAVNGWQSPRDEYVTRVPGRAIAEQVGELLAALGCEQSSREAHDIRICSSANGGLNLGLLSLSRKVSGGTVLRLLESVGANVRFHHVWRQAVAQDAVAVDVLVLAGGIDDCDSGSVADGLASLSLDGFVYDRLVCAVHADCRDMARECWPHVEIVENPLQEGLVPSNRALGRYMRQTYLDDIESKKDLQPLRPVSVVPIEPTPTVVSRAFELLQARMPSPAILLDIGGATTDLHFVKELLDDTDLNAGELAAYPPICRHVFTAYGVHDSKASTIAALLDDPKCPDLLGVLYRGRHREVYQQLLEGEAPQWLLFCASFFLALRASIEGHAEAPRLHLGALASVMVTGGAAKCISQDDVSTVLHVATGWMPRARIFLDTEYRWWTLGLMDRGAISEETWRALNG